jgi:hypothetical protein
MLVAVAHGLGNSVLVSPAHQVVELLVEFLEPVGDLLHAVRIGGGLQQNAEQQQGNDSKLEFD